MKTKKLKLNKVTVSALERNDLENFAGGAKEPFITHFLSGCPSCAIPATGCA